MPHPETRSSLLPNLLLVAGSVVASLVLLGLLEGAARLAGVGDLGARRTSRLEYQQLHFPTLEAGRRADGTPVLHPVDPRLRFASLLAEKPETTTRIITFGGSATAGLGYSPNGTFSRELERLLLAARPDRDFEVLNLGIVALASKQVKLLVAEAVRDYDPDAVVIHSGNNEFLEIHAEKYAEATATPTSRLVAAVGELALYRFIRSIVRGDERGGALQERALSNEDLQLTQSRIIEQVTMAPGEITAAIDGYEANLEAMVDAAEKADVPVLLLTVATNWEWRGRSDLDEGWIDELLGSGGGPTTDRLALARTELTRRIDAGAGDDLHTLLFQRASAAVALGDVAAARGDYRAAMNADPHLRRALDAANDRVRALAEARGTGFVDTVELLAARREDGIVGFDAFYDYVHFTPRGNAIVAGAIFDGLARMGVVPAAPGFDSAARVRERLAEIAALDLDPRTVEDWLGFCFDRAMLTDRDLWKYDRSIADLDRRIDADPTDATALAYRGNAAYFRIDGGAEAARDYRAALEHAPDDAALRSNLDRLLAEGRAPATD